MYALRIQNTSDSDPRSYKVTEQLQRKPRKDSETDHYFILGFLCNC